MAASHILLDQIRYNIKNRITLISLHNSMFPKYQISLTKTGLLCCSLLSLGRINHATAWTEIRLKIASTKLNLICIVKITLSCNKGHIEVIH